MPLSRPPREGEGGTHSFWQCLHPKSSSHSYIFSAPCPCLITPSRPLPTVRAHLGVAITPGAAATSRSLQWVTARGAVAGARRQTVHDAGERLFLQLLRGGRAGPAPGLAGGGQRAALRDRPSSLGGAHFVCSAHHHHRGGRRGQPPGHPLGAQEPQTAERG